MVRPRGYRHPLEDPRGWVEQDYLPEHLAGTRYYQPSEHGREAEMKDRPPFRESGSLPG